MFALVKSRNFLLTLFDSVSHGVFQCCLFISVSVLANSCLRVGNHWCDDLPGAAAV